MAAQDPVAVGQAFVKHYYTLFDGDRASLRNLYVCEHIFFLRPFFFDMLFPYAALWGIQQDCSMVTFEGIQLLGTGPIMEKLGV